MTAEDRLIAIEQISMLKARYFRFADTKDWEELRGLFTPDATLFYPEGQDAPTSRDESIERIKEVLAGVVRVHQGHTPEIEILSPDRATGIWAMEDLLFFPPERARAIGVESSHGYGHYHEEDRKSTRMQSSHKC